MDKIIKVVKADIKEITIGGETYIVNDSLKTLCKKILRLYEIMIAIFVVIGINVAPMIGSSGFFADMLFVVILLALLSLVFNFLAEFLLKKAVRG